LNRPDQLNTVSFYTCGEDTVSSRRISLEAVISHQDFGNTIQIQIIGQ
jgi:hypothetical protein